MEICDECKETIRIEHCRGECGKKFLACGCDIGYCTNCEIDLYEENIAFDYTQDGEGDGIIPLY